MASSPYMYISSFKAGTERNVKITYTLPLSAPLGYWTYDVYLYRSSTVLDKVAGQGFTVETPFKSGEILVIADSPGPVLHGKTATFTIVVKNTGNTIWSSGKVTIKIHKPDSTTVYTTKSLSISNIAPGVEYTYNLKWAVSSYATTGTYTYDVYFYYGTSTLMDSDVGDPSNTITIN